MKRFLTKWPLTLSSLLLLLTACSSPAPAETEAEAAGETAVPTTETTTLAATDTAQPPPAAPTHTTAPLPTETAVVSRPEATKPGSATEAPGDPLPEPPTELAPAYAEYELVTLLPPDGIPAIDDPQFLSAAEADQFYDPSEFIIGVSIDGDHRAYSIPLLSNHEIVNDTVGGRQIAVTW